MIKTLMEIKENTTRISFWFNEKRYSKIELNKLIITYGYSNRNRNLWNVFKFSKIDNCLELLEYFILEKKYKISLKEKQVIKKLYVKLFTK